MTILPCVGFLFLVVRFPARSRPPAAARLPTHNLSTHNLSTHNLSTHTLVTHNLSPHNLSTHKLVTTQLAHTQLAPHTTCHTTYSLAHTQLVHTQLAHTQLVHTQLVTHTTCHHTTCLTHNLLTHTTCPHTTCPHTTCSHTTCSHTTCPHTTYSHTTCPQHFAWQAWHLSTHNFVWQHGSCIDTWHTTCTHRGRRGTYGTGLALVARLGHTFGANVVADASLRGRHWRLGDIDRPLCVAGVALGDMDVTLRGRRGTWHWADMDVHFAWQWHLWHWAGSGGALGSQLTPWAPRLFAWHWRHGHFAWQAWHLATSTVTLRGRRGTW